MGQIPADATHWDSGDWIEWHRSLSGLDDSPCTEAAPDEPLARLTSLHVNLLRAAKGYFQLTGYHLPVYQQLAQTHVAIHCDMPFEGPERTCEETGVEILHMPPHAGNDIVHVDLTKPFLTLFVVRVKNNFTTEARMIQRAGLPEAHEEPYRLRWNDLPHKL
ncbi:MAG: hypothetical protein AAGF27_05665 [Pseudomonadota bacterium]